MSAVALQKQAMDYFIALDDNQVKMVISFIKNISQISETKTKRSFADLKGKIQFADNYDYKEMRINL